MHVELRMLRALVMVEASGSIARAARGLAFSPAAVSAHLRALEKECGVRLVERTGEGMRLTEEGRRAVPIARLMLVAAAELERLGRPPAPALTPMRGVAHTRMSAVDQGTRTNPDDR